MSILVPRILRLPILVLGGLLACLVAPAAARAQVATVTVTVTDPEGQPAQYVDVRLEGTEGNPNTFADITDDTGTFTFSAVPPGKYVATAVYEGQVSDRFNIELGPGGSSRIRIPLRRIEALEQVIEIRADLSELVDVTSVATITEFSGEFISKVPLINRQIQDIVFMMPGVIKVGGADSTEISIGGGTSAQIAYRIDGISANNLVDGGLNFQLPTAAIQSFKLIANGASARYGEQSTGVAEIVTKSGGNENDFAYEMQYRDSGAGAQSLDGLEDAQQAVHDLMTANDTILAPELEAGFKLLGVDPISTLDDDNNPPPRRRIRHTVSAGGPIKKDVAFFHSTLEMVQDDFGSAFVDGMDKNDSILWTSKLNWNLDENNKNRLEFTGNLDVRDGSGFTDFTSERSGNLVTSSGAWSFGVTDTHLFDNQSVLETKLSVAHDYQTTRPENVREGVGTTYQIPLPPGGPVSYFVGDAFLDFDQDVTTIKTEANYSHRFGNRNPGQHTLDLGFAADQSWFRSYTARGTQVVDLRVIDDSSALGQDPSIAPGREITYGPPVETDDQAWYMGLYASDNWQVTDNFVLQMGMRAEYQSFIGEIYLAPRVGFSLDPIGDGKTRFFGNWGIYHDRVFANLLQFTQNPDRLWADIRWADAYNDPNQRRFSAISIEDMYKDARSRTRSTGPGAIAYRQELFEDRFVAADDITAPTTKAWQLGISRELPGTIRLQVTYSANTRTHQIQNDTITRRASVLGSAEIRDIVYGTTGEGQFRQWSAEISRPFSKNWSMNLSYVQSRNVGPIAPLQNPIDPADVAYVDGVLGNDRTHVVKLQGTTKIGPGKKAWDASVDFTWQSGLPITPTLYRAGGARVEPIGRNALRLPSMRNLNFGVSKNFTLNTAEGGGFLPTIGIRAQIFNVLNELNVTNAIARFESPDGVSNPQAFPPLRPELTTTGVDLSRSLEVGFSISF